MTRPDDDERRQELLRQLSLPNGLELVMRRYEQLLGHFPPAEISPKQIIDAILQAEQNACQ